MVRNRNVEILRAGAILSVLLYHFYIISGKTISGTILPTLLSMGGELGVTMFFVLSGFGIGMLLNSKAYSYSTFIKSRLRKLIPEYYLCLIVLLLLTEQCVYLNKEHIWNVLSHFLFLHSLNISHHGAINGVLWTMSVLMQFYFLSYWIWKLQKKSLIYSFLLIAGSLITKRYVYHYYLPDRGLCDSTYYFIYGRQIFTALDNFVVGMLVSEMLYRGKKMELPKIAAVIGLILLAGWLALGYRRGIYCDDSFSVIWHFVCAILCGCLVLAFYSDSEIGGAFVKPFHWIAKYNYGIYLWHLVLANNIIARCHWAQELSYIPFTCIMIFLSCAIGYTSSCFNKLFLSTQKCNFHKTQD